ncbi:DNA topoisomerase [Gaertneriomyces sp. JEL0708]|nr:DNA topoisomerase [Gaertneriomyces sp. JEL0708]
MKILCVAEKPSIAKSVAQLLSNNNCRAVNTESKYIKNYCFDSTWFGQPCQVVMTCVVGHLMELDFPTEYRSWNGTPIPRLFDAPVNKLVKKEHAGIENNLRKEARYARTLVIWTDCDREGENIGAEVVDVCIKANPSLQIKRARFSVIQRREIQQAWNSPVELDMRQSYAVDARSELDLRIGAVFTRFQTLTLKAEFADKLGENAIISYGSCQFPTLGFVVERFRRVQQFVPEDFWKLEMTVTKDGEAVNFEWERDRLFDKHLTLVLYENCMDNPMATVVYKETKPKSKWAPLPLTTVELQKAGSRCLRMSADRIMTVAEKLYNKGIISYPRTETDVFADNFHLHPLIQAQVNDRRWGNYAQNLLNGAFVRPRKGRSDDQAHPPIHPVKEAADLSPEEDRVYDYITRRFLACCSAAAKGEETVVKAIVGGERFTAKGLNITERNYLEVFTFDTWSEHTIPHFQRGERMMPSRLEMNTGHTTGPNLLTEADLIGLMEKSGIGTDATIHEHIKKIIDREYVNKDGPGNRYFCPTVLGMALIEAYDEMALDLSLAKPYLRSQMETNMKGIADGGKTKHEVIQESVDMYREAFSMVVGRYLNGNFDTAGPGREILYNNEPSNDYNELPPLPGDDDSPPHPGPGRRRGTSTTAARARSTRGRGAARGSSTAPGASSSSTGTRGTRSLRGARGGSGSRASRGSGASATRGRDPPGRAGHGRKTENGKPKCECDLFATVKVVRKQNENEGREFYTCAKAGKQCRFFAWVDEWSG